MKHQQKHRITQGAVRWFLELAGRGAKNDVSYPISYGTLSLMIGETLPIAIERVPHLSIERVTDVLERLDLPYKAMVLDRYAALAGFLYARNGGGVVFIEETDSEERQKFSLAHELGHFVNDYYRPVYVKYEHSSTIPLFQEEQTAQLRQVVSARCTKRDIFGEGEPEILKAKTKDANQVIVELLREQKEKFKEIKANFFAAELLMPMEECRRIEHECEGASQEELTAALMKQFGVSRSAAAIRVEELRLGIMEEWLL